MIQLNDTIAAVATPPGDGGVAVIRISGPDALHVLEGFNPNLLDEQDARYRCDCSRERMERALISLGRKELTELSKEQDEIEIGCQFCGSSYTFKASELLKTL